MGRGGGQRARERCRAGQEVGRVQPRDHQRVAGRDGVQRQEREDRPGLVDNLRGLLPAHDAAEVAVPHLVTLTAGPSYWPPNGSPGGGTVFPDEDDESFDDIARMSTLMPGGGGLAGMAAYGLKKLSEWRIPEPGPRDTDSVRLIHASDLQSWSRFPRCQDADTVTYGQYRSR